METKRDICKVLEGQKASYWKKKWPTRQQKRPGGKHTPADLSDTHKGTRGDVKAEGWVVTSWRWELLKLCIQQLDITF